MNERRKMSEEDVKIYQNIRIVIILIATLIFFGICCGTYSTLTEIEMKRSVVEQLKDQVELKINLKSEDLKEYLK